MYRFVQKKQTPCFKRWSRNGYGAFASIHRHVTIGVLAVGMSIISLAGKEAMAQSYDTVRLNQYLDSLMVFAEKASPTRSVMAQTLTYSRKENLPAVAQTVEQILRTSPSVDVRERGGKGVQADISIRGGSFDQTQLMLNGVDFTDARTGHQTHALPIDAECISSIELLDGVQGTGAYAGALNMIVTPPYENYLRATITGGAHGYGYGNLNGAMQKGGLNLFAAASYRFSDGYIQNTDFTNTNLYLRSSYSTQSVGAFDFQAGYQKRDFGANGFYSLKYPNQFEQTRTALGSLRWYANFGRVETNATISYRFNKDCFQLIKGDESKVPFNHHITHNIGASGWVAYKWLLGKSTLGFDYTGNSIWSTVLGDKLDEPKHIGSIDYTRHKSRGVGNFWLRHSLQRGKWGAAASGGISTTPYGTRGSGSAELTYYMSSATKLYAGAVSSMRLPSFNDLYYTATGYVGNMDLVPEKAFMVRGGVEHRSDNLSASGILFWRRGSNVIDWIRRSADADWESMQITSMNTYGAELSVNYMTTKGFLRSAGISYGLIYTDKSSQGYISKYALDYMRNKLSLSASVALYGTLMLSANGTLYDRRDYPSYFLLNAKLQWSWRMLTLFVEAENITDKEYYDYSGLRMPGFWLSGGLSLTIR